MTATASKPELYALTEALHRNGANTTQIGSALGYSNQTIRNILIELGITRRRSLSEILQTLDRDLVLRAEILKNQRREQQANPQAA